MQASVAEEGSPIGMLNVAFMLQHGLGYNAADRHALAYDLLLRAARLERYYGDGLVDAAAIIYDGDRYACHGFRLHVALEPSFPQRVAASHAILCPVHFDKHTSSGLGKCAQSHPPYVAHSIRQQVEMTGIVIVQCTRYVCGLAGLGCQEAET